MLRESFTQFSEAIAEAKAEGKSVYPILYTVFYFTTTIKIYFPFHCTLNSTYNKKYAEIFLHYRWLFVKGNVIIGEWEIFGAEVCLHYSHFFVKDNFVIGGVECILMIYLALQILLLFTDADMKPAGDLTNLATLDVEDILAKSQDISIGVLFKVCQSLLKEWGADSLEFYQRT